MPKASSNNSEHFVLDWTIPPELEIDEVACAVNAIMTLVHNLPHSEKITLEEIKEKFHYSHEGIRNEKFLFRRFNTQILRKKGCPCHLSLQVFHNKKDLISQLEKYHLPIPVYFDIDILDKVNPLLRQHTGYEFNTKDAHLNYNSHIMLFIGYGNAGNDLYFVDPNFLLPTHREETFKIKDKAIILNTQELSQFTKLRSLFIEVRCPKKTTKQIKNDLTTYFGT